MWILVPVGGVVALITAVRMIRWWRLTARNPVVLWTVGSVNQVFVGTGDLLWYQTLLDPARLAATAHDLAASWARTNAMHTVLGRMTDVVDRLRAAMSHPDVLPGIADLTHVEVAVGLHDTASVAGAPGGDTQDHLVEWMYQIPGQPDAIDTDVVLLDAGYASTAIDAVGSVGVLGALALVRHGYKAYQGDKTVAEALQDGSIEVVAKWAAGGAALTVVAAAMDTVTFGAATAAVAAGRIAAGALLKALRRKELRRLKRALRDSVAEVGAELYIDGRHADLKAAIWAPWQRNRDAVAVLSRAIRRARLRPWYWIWPAPQDVMYIRARRRGRQEMNASNREATTMTNNLSRLDASPDRDVLAGKLLIRSPRLQADLGIPTYLVRQAKTAHTAVLTEADHLRRRYGY